MLTDKELLQRAGRLASAVDCLLKCSFEELGTAIEKVSAAYELYDCAMVDTTLERHDAVKAGKIPEGASPWQIIEGSYTVSSLKRDLREAEGILRQLHVPIRGSIIKTLLRALIQRDSEIEELEEELEDYGREVEELQKVENSGEWPDLDTKLLGNHELEYALEDRKTQMRLLLERHDASDPSTERQRIALRNSINKIVCALGLRTGEKEKYLAQLIIEDDML